MINVFETAYKGKVYTKRSSLPTEMEFDALCRGIQAVEEYDALAYNF